MTSWKLVHKNDLTKEVKIGDILHCPKDEVTEKLVTYLEPPHKPSASGKVHLRPADIEEATPLPSYVHCYDLVFMTEEQVQKKLNPSLDFDNIVNDLYEAQVHVDELHDSFSLFLDGVADPYDYEDRSLLDKLDEALEHLKCVKSKLEEVHD